MHDGYFFNGASCLIVGAFALLLLAANLFGGVVSTAVGVLMCALLFGLMAGLCGFGLFAVCVRPTKTVCVTSSLGNSFVAWGCLSMVAIARGAGADGILYMKLLAVGGAVGFALTLTAALLGVIARRRSGV